MKNLFLVILFVCMNILFSYGSMRGEAAQYQGLKGRLTFRVVDTSGSAVSNVNVEAYFRVRNLAPTCVQSMTDTGGCCSVEGKTSLEAVCRFSKQGYYDTRIRHFFWDITKNCVGDGRWLPWNPTVPIVLKEQKHRVAPVPHRVVHLLLPRGDTEYGVDLLKSDLVEPFGRGVITDIVVSCHGAWRGDCDGAISLMLRGVGEDEGFVRAKRDEWSDFKFMLEAPTNGYVRQMKFNFVRTPAKIITDNKPSSEEYLVARSRSRKNGPKGSAILFHYSIIYKIYFGAQPDPQKGGGITLNYTFNPREDERSLEYDFMRE